MTALRLVGLFAVGLGCRATNGLTVERIGSDAAQPFAIVGADVLIDDGSHIERIGPDGVMRWRSDARGKWATPHDRAESTFVVGVSDNVSEAPLLDVDLNTGASRRRCFLRPGAFAEWYRFGEALMLADLGSIERINPNTCDYVWSEHANGSPVDHSTSDEFWIAGALKVRAFAIADGSMREMDSGTWVSMTRELVIPIDEMRVTASDQPVRIAN